MEHEDPLKAYQRLVETDNESFLDFDTTLVFDLRDEIEEMLESKPSDIDLAVVSRLDEVLKQKVRADLARIKANGGGADPQYANDVVDFLRHIGAKEPRGHWWYHLIE